MCVYYYYCSIHTLYCNRIYCITIAQSIHCTIKNNKLKTDHRLKPKIIKHLDENPVENFL